MNVTGVRFGVKAGINIANLTVKPRGDESAYNSLIGINGGFLLLFLLQQVLQYNLN